VIGPAVGVAANLEDDVRRRIVSLSDLEQRSHRDDIQQGVDVREAKPFGVRDVDIRDRRLDPVKL
jgi:hypothetical protein